MTASITAAGLEALERNLALVTPVVPQDGRAIDNAREALRQIVALLEAGDAMRGVEPAAWRYERVHAEYGTPLIKINPTRCEPGAEGRVNPAWTETPLYTADQFAAALALAKAGAAPAPVSDDEREALYAILCDAGHGSHQRIEHTLRAILPLIALAKSRAVDEAREACARVADDLALNYEAWRQNADPLENGRDALAFKHKREAAREVASQIRALSLPAAPEAPPVIDLVELHAAMLEEVARSTPIRSMRMGLTIAARAIRRGRTLTAEEKLANFKAAMAEWPEDPAPAAPEEQGNEAAFIASIDPALKAQFERAAAAISRLPPSMNGAATGEILPPRARIAEIITSMLRWPQGEALARDIADAILEEAPPSEADAVAREREAIRQEICALCENMEENGYAPGGLNGEDGAHAQGFERGYRKAAKSIRNALCDTIRARAAGGGKP